MRQSAKVERGRRRVGPSQQNGKILNTTAEEGKAIECRFLNRERVKPGRFMEVYSQNGGRKVKIYLAERCFFSSGVLPGVTCIDLMT